MRLVSDSLVAEERREYFRKWRAANRDKTKLHRENYWRRRAQKKFDEQEVQNDGK